MTLKGEALQTNSMFLKAITFVNGKFRLVLCGIGEEIKALAL